MKKDSNISLLLNYTTDNLTFEANNSINMSAYLYVPDSGDEVSISVTPPEVYPSTKAGYAGPAAELLFDNVTFMIPGNYEVKSRYNGNDNYTEDVSILYANVTDIYPPEITLMRPSAEQWLSSNKVLFRFSVFDYAPGDIRCNLYINDELNVSNIILERNTISEVTEELYVNTSKGRNTYYVECNDSLGYVSSSETRNFTVDMYPPDVEILSPLDNSVYAKFRINLTFHVNDNLDENLTYYIPKASGELRGKIDVYHQKIVPVDLETGVNVIRVTVTDEAGNSAYDEVTVNRTGAAVKLIGPGYKEWRNTDIVDFSYRFEETDDDILNCSLYVNDTYLLSNSSSVEFVNTTVTANLAGVVEDGVDIPWRIRCIGDTTDISAYSIFSLDRTPPVLINQSAHPINITIGGQWTNFTSQILDNIYVDTVLIENDFDGLHRNSTVNCNLIDDTFTYNISCYYYDQLNKGNYSYRYIINDSGGNILISNWFTYNISDLFANVSLRLQGPDNPDPVDGNITVDQDDEPIKIITEFVYPAEGYIEVFDNGVLRFGTNGTAETVFYLPAYHWWNAGWHNITVLFYADEHKGYLHSGKTRWIYVREVFFEFLEPPTPEDGAYIGYNDPGFKFTMVQESDPNQNPLFVLDGVEFITNRTKECNVYDDNGDYQESIPYYDENGNYRNPLGNEPIWMIRQCNMNPSRDYCSTYENWTYECVWNFFADCRTNDSLCNLSNGLHDYYAAGYDNRGNYGFSNTRNFTIVVPIIANVTAEPNPQGQGAEVTLTVNLNSSVVEQVVTEITGVVYAPDGNVYTIDLVNISDLVWVGTVIDYDFGEYDVELTATNNYGYNSETAYTAFNYTSRVYSHIQTLKDSYQFDEEVYVTDPPPAPPPNIEDFGVLDLGITDSEGPIPIHNCVELNNTIRDNISGDYYLADDIDCSETKEWNPDGSDYLGWDPIEDVFSGTLDGNDKEINGLYINRQSEDDVALFEALEGAEISNLELTDVNITGSSGVAGLASSVLDSDIDKVWVRGEISAYGDFVGGIAGDVIGDSEIKESRA
ncbi:MAG: hypothetical protein GF350_11815, partial [Chitinivibrionales bacterium]|nr:hypothetical protein [Chitinivibrionales bacterium]